MTRYVVGIDLGASLLKYIIMREDGTLGEAGRIPSRDGEGPEGVLNQIRKAIERASSNIPQGDGIVGLGLGTPGLINREGEIIGEAVNIPGWHNVPLQKLVADMVRFPVFVQNDVNITALGEYLHGAGKGYDNMVCLSIGTGIGGGLIVDGRMYAGDFGLAGEIGHIIADHDGELCSCGQHGCLEQYASAKGIVSRCLKLAPEFDSPLAKLSRANTEGLTAETIFAYIRKEDALGLRLRDTACLMLARVMGQVLNLLSPSLFVLCGGVMKSADLILSKVTEYLPRYSLPVMLKHCAVKAGALGPDAGVIGAAAYALVHIRDGARGE